MRSTLLLIILAVAITVISCKQEASNTSQAPAQDTTAVASSAEGHDYTFLTQGILHYTGGIISGKDPRDEPFKGHWIDLEPNGSFTSGVYGDKTSGGRWAYNHDQKKLALMPDDTSQKPSEWNVMYNENMVVLVGTATYGDNNTQARLERFTELPKQQ